MHRNRSPHSIRLSECTRGTSQHRSHPSLFFLTVVLIALSHSSPAATTLYWGGGNADITGPQALPAAGAANGTWDEDLTNWAIDTSGSAYQAWAADAIANFGPRTSGTTITLSDNLSVGGVLVQVGNNTTTFSSASSQILTMVNGGSFLTSSNSAGQGIGRGLVFGNNVILAGTNGFSFSKNPTGSTKGNLIFSSQETHTISGIASIIGIGNLSAGSLTIVNGQFPNISGWHVSAGGTLRLNSPAAGNENRIADSATVRLRTSGTLDLRLDSDRSELIGTLDISNSKGRLVLGSAGNANTRLEFTSLNRGTHGVLEFEGLQNYNGRVVVNSALESNVALPWAYNRPGTDNFALRFVQYDTSVEGSETFRTVNSLDAPSDLSTWATYTAATNLHFDVTDINFFSEALSSDITLRTLALGAPQIAGANNLLDLGGNVLTVQGIAMASRVGGTGGIDTINRISNGWVTTGAGVSQLYLSSTTFGNTQSGGRHGASSHFNAVLGSPTALANSTRTNDVIIAGTSYDSSNGTGVFRFESDVDYNYIGTMYIVGSGLIGTRGGTVEFNGAGRKVTGNLVLEEGAELDVVGANTNAFAPTSLVTLAEGSRLNTRATSSSSGTQSLATLRGLVGTGRVTIGTGNHSALEINTPNDQTHIFDGVLAGNSTSGTGSFHRITKLGEGTQVLNGVNTYNQNTLIEEGTWVINGTHTNEQSGRGYTIHSGATLAGGGAISLAGSGTVTLLSGGFISPGDDGPGTLTMSSLTWDEGAQMNFQLGATLLGSDYLELGSGALTRGALDAGGWQFNFDVAATNPLTDLEYKLIGFGSSVDFDVTDFTYVFSPTLAGYLDSGTFDLRSDGLYFNAIAFVIPEPSRLLLLGLGLVTLTLRRRRA